MRLHYMNEKRAVLVFITRQEGRIRKCLLSFNKVVDSCPISSETFMIFKGLRCETLTEKAAASLSGAG